MISKDLQKLLHDHQIDIYLKDGALAVRAASGGVEQSVLAILRAHKADLIAWLGGLESEGPTDIRPEARRAAVAPASRSQQALWAIGELGAGGDHYTIPLRADLFGRVDEAALNRSFLALGARHDALRTVFRMQDGTLQQVVTDRALTLAHRQKDEEGLRLDEIEARFFGAPFDVQAGPLFRAKLVCLTPEHSVLLLWGHHLILDGASLGVLVEDLCALYRAEVTGERLALDPPGLQFSDFSDWQQRLARSSEQERSNRYWQDNLAHAPVVHGLPLDAPRAGRPSFTGDRMSCELPQEKSAALLRLAAQMNTTPFVLMLTAYALVIARHSNESDLVISMPVANRHRPEFAQTVGYLANVLPLRLRVDANLSFAGLVQVTHQEVFSAFDHQDVPFERIVELVNPPRNLSHNPLSQIMISMDNFVSDRFRMHDLEVALGPVEDSSAKLDLALAVRVQDGIIGLHWNWATALFHRGTIERLAGHFQEVLDSILAHPQAVAAELNMIGAHERARLLGFSIGETVDFDEDELCHDIFDQIARAQPDAPAIRDEAGTLSYGQLRQRADHAACHILETIGPANQPVGILCTRRAEFVIAQLAILKSGNVFVPIDPGSPAARIQTIIAGAGMRLVLTADGMTVPSLPESVRVISLSDLSDGVGKASLPCFPPRKAEDAAYIVFTSGSTGTPKGAVIPFRGLRYMTLPQVMRYEMTPQTVMTVSANVAFDSILWEIWPTLVSGGCLVMTPDAVLADPALLSRHICQHRPTHFWLPTGMLELFCSLHLDWPDSIRMVFTGGDRLLRNCLPDPVRMKLVNIYGPTECSVWATCHDVVDGGPEPAPIGRPLFNTATFVMDPEGRMLPQGAIGEIVIAGKGVGSGYLGREDLTRKAFLSLPDHPTGYH
ncbi:MAG: condensation domain-containing protein, partial [Rhodobacteraceae bacterium]|nr:condensation domain-containing protein [Paracoccaceae bacterium]